MTSPRIPLIRADLPALESLEAEFREILGNGRVTNFGRYVQQFEAEAGNYLGTDAVCLSSATAGLVMTLQALGVPRGSRVAMPSFSFVATGQAVLYAGCTPVFLDITEDGNVDPEDLRRTLRQRLDVRAALLVHMYGLPCQTMPLSARNVDREARDCRCCTTRRTRSDRRGMASASAARERPRSSRRQLPKS
jgi:dTDP-4-amino-4,6-dideoxygalactose transaminase